MRLSLAILALLVALATTTRAFPQASSVQIGYDADDGTEVDQAVWYDDEELNCMGSVDGQSHDIALRFHLPDLNPGDSFVYARLLVPGTGDGQIDSGLNLRVVGVNDDGVAPFGELPPSQLPRTVATVDWSVSANWPQPTADYDCTPLRRYSPDISPIINEILQRPGWGSGPDGKTLAIVIEGSSGSGTNYLTVRDYYVLEPGSCTNLGHPARVVSPALELYPSVASTFLAQEMLGRPSDHSVTVNALSLLTLEVYFDCGTGPGQYTQQTAVESCPGQTPFEVVLDQLSADTEYCYRMRYRRPEDAEFLAGPERSFHTQRAPDSTFVFTIQTDSHLQNAVRGNRLGHMALYRQTLANALADQPDFHIDLGDTFQSEHYGGRCVVDFEEAFQRHLDQRPYLDLLCHSTPFFSVLGNHEGEQGWRLDGDPDNLAIWAANARKLLYPNPVPDDFYTGNQAAEPLVGLRENYYAWEWGDALFVVLDPYWYTTNDPHDAGSDNWDWTLGATQYQWFQQVLENSAANLKFVFSHQMVGGLDGYGRGGIEAARYSVWGNPSFEWGGEDHEGNYVFDSMRPGWELPIHQLMAQHHVAVWFHGHDHLFVKQDLEGIVYQECPKPSDANYSFGAGWAYALGDILPNSGHLRVTVSPAQVTVEYVRAYLAGDGPNGEIAYSYTITDCNGNGVPDTHDIASGSSHDWNGNGTPDECECLGDLDNDAIIGAGDLQVLISSYGSDAGGDLDGDGDTDLPDLAILLALYGETCD
ncbi:MAG: metallophosphoesterase [Planctomycetes bacterium]|nr:metallophosphoesterase [Planctomycetota bacterium]